MWFVFICKKVGLFYINRTCKHENSDVSPLQTPCKYYTLFFFSPILILPFTLTILFHWMNWQHVFFQNKLDFFLLFGYEINWSDTQTVMFGNKCARSSKPAPVWICKNTLDAASGQSAFWNYCSASSNVVLTQNTAAKMPQAHHSFSCRLQDVTCNPCTSWQLIN